MTALLIHPDSRITALTGSLPAQAATLAVLAQATWAAGAELGSRCGGDGPLEMHLHQDQSSLYILSVAERGLLLIQHRGDVSVETVRNLARRLNVSAALPVPPPAPRAIRIPTIGDALNVPPP